MMAGPLPWILVSLLSSAAIAAAVVGLIVVNRRLQVRRMADPVEGTVQVTGSSAPSPYAMYSNYRLAGVVTAPGLAATPVENRGIARVTKWPFPGRTLPVLVDRAEPKRLQIRWDRVPTGREAAAEQAERLAQAMRQQGAHSAGSAWTAQSPDAGGAPPTDTAAEAVAAAVRASLSQLGLTTGNVTVRTSTPVGAPLGEAATAVVIATRDVPPPPGERTPPGGAIELTLYVTRADGSRHTALTKVLFSSAARRARFGSIGARLPVRLDPVDPSRATIDPAALDLSDAA
jgi:hypothetical protein